MRLVAQANLDGWPVGGRVVIWSMAGQRRVPLTIAAASLLVISLCLAWLTHGFTEAGPRLQWVLFAVAGLSTASGVLPGAALLAVAVTVALIVALSLLAVIALFVIIFALASSA